jgi:hypothetical protein
MKRSSKFLIILSALVGGMAVVAFAMFVLGTPWIAALNPHFALADWTNEDTTVTEITATTDDRGREATLLSAFFGLDGELSAHSTKQSSANETAMSTANWERLLTADLTPDKGVSPTIHKFSLAALRRTRQRTVWSVGQLQAI